MSLWIRVEAMAGDTVQHTAAEMRSLANRVSVGVRCRFNGVDLYMPVNGCDKALAYDYVAVCADSRKLKMAFGYANRSA